MLDMPLPSLPGNHPLANSHVSDCCSRHPQQTKQQSADCVECYLSWVAAVGRASFTLRSKCEVTVYYCYRNPADTILFQRSLLARHWEHWCRPTL